MAKIIVVRTSPQSHAIFVERDNLDEVVIQTYDNFCHGALLYKLIYDIFELLKDVTSLAD